MKKIHRIRLAELGIDVEYKYEDNETNGQIVITKDGKLEYNDVDNLTPEETEYITQEAREFIKYRKSRKSFIRGD